ncbi:MAG TPA: RNA polymerase sigma-70 factor [Lentimicrobium sp.]|nr:RNA polymerase sigma-70 factor [Lentimicrobium sp.]
MGSDSEKLTLLALRRGDQQVFESVFREYYEPLCIHARRYVVDPEAAEEVVQDMFFKMWDRRDSLVINTSLPAYLFKAVSNHALNYIKYQRLARQYQDYVGFATGGDLAATGHDALVHDDLERRFRSLVIAMPERRQMIFEMSRFEGLKYNEIAQKLNISIKTVEVQMSKALEFMRNKLSDYLPSWWWVLLFINLF